MAQISDMYHYRSLVINCSDMLIFSVRNHTVTTQVTNYTIIPPLCPASFCFYHPVSALLRFFVSMLLNKVTLKTHFLTWAVSNQLE